MGRKVEKSNMKVAPVKVNLYGILVDKVEEAVMYGWNRAHKYTDGPDGEVVREQIRNAVMNELAELFVWGDE